MAMVDYSINDVGNIYIVAEKPLDAAGRDFTLINFRLINDYYLRRVIQSLVTIS
jgi:hypothetical protein